MSSSKHSTFEVRDYVTGAKRGGADSYLDAAGKATTLADGEGKAFSVVEIAMRCIITPTKGIKVR